MWTWTVTPSVNMRNFLLLLVPSSCVRNCRSEFETHRKQNIGGKRVDQVCKWGKVKHLMNNMKSGIKQKAWRSKVDKKPCKPGTADSNASTAVFLLPGWCGTSFNPPISISRVLPVFCWSWLLSAVPFPSNIYPLQ